MIRSSFGQTDPLEQALTLLMRQGLMPSLAPGFRVKPESGRLRARRRCILSHAPAFLGGSEALPGSSAATVDVSVAAECCPG